jgi:hypothetical protein
MPPVFTQQPAGPPPTYARQPYSPPAGWAPQGRPAVPPQLAQGQDLSRPVVRGQMPDAPPPRPAPLTMPSPEQLGLTRAASVATADGRDAVDWNAALERVRRLGATGFHLTRLPQGGHQVTLLLPTAQADRSQYVEVTASTEAAAVRIALDRAEQRVAQR